MAKLITHAKDLLLSVADLLWPPQCHICGEIPGPESKWLCTGCYNSLPLTRFNYWEENPMTMRLAGKIPFAKASAWLIYHPKGKIAPLFHDFKYHGFKSLAHFMGTQAATRVDSFIFKDIDALIPIPIHPLKKLRRGYNQTMEIAKGINAIKHIPIAPGLKAIRPHRSQTTLSGTRRTQNTKGIFRYTPHPQYQGRHLLIIDDICTTGSTLISAAEAILAADPQATISFFTLAVVL